MLRRLFPSSLMSTWIGVHGSILRGMTIVAMFILTAKGVAAVKEMVVAQTFGTGSVIDAYLFVFNLTVIPAALWYSIAAAVVIPLDGRLRNSAPAEERRFRAELLGAVILLGLAVGLIAWLALRLLLGFSTLGLDAETHRHAVTSVNYLAFAVPLGLAANSGSVLLMSKGRHANSLLEGMPALVLLGALLLWSVGGLQVLLWGTLAGFAAQLAITMFLLRGEVPRPRFGFASPAWAEFRAAASIMFVTQLLMTLPTVLDQFFAADMAGGSIATLGYATRIQALLLALGATTIGRAILPIFVRMKATEPDALYRVARRWTWLLFASGAGLVLLIWPFAEHIVRLLFERGAFTADNTREVTEVLRWSLTQLPFYFAMITASQLLYSDARYQLAAWLAFAGLILKLSLSFILVGPLGLVGLVVSTTAMQAFSCGVLLWALRARSTVVRA
jgi:putative peptidoglycan lipid II flippase